LKHREVFLGLGRGLGEEYGLIREDWGYDRVKMGLKGGTIG